MSRLLDDPRFAGIQLAIAEVLWPSQEGLVSISISEANGGAVHLQFAHVASEQERESCTRLLGEIFAEAFEALPSQPTVSFGLATPLSGDHVVLRSAAIANEIYREVAPWRLS